MCPQGIKTILSSYSSIQPVWKPYFRQEGFHRKTEVFTLPHLFRLESDWIAWTPRTVLGLVLAERPAKCPFRVQASPSGIRQTTQSLWTVHGLDPSGVQVESSLDSLLLYFKKYLCRELNP
jgi:hypothetical protein